jgi:3'-phosphoadenosine 5'-phosphosulfate sulfotransferase (PAPS reductase)/FAD synthetase
MKDVMAYSGGKDSTAMAVALAKQGEQFELFFTPTGNELPELLAHIQTIVKRIDRPLIVPENKSLEFWINEFNALPNWRQRWCTRLIKIKPCIAYLQANPGSTLLIGLRADEELREGLYGPYATYRYPLREMGWGIADVQGFLHSEGIKVPKRTDCAFCYGQRLSEWFTLWKSTPVLWSEGEATTRNATTDSWG